MTLVYGISDVVRPLRIDLESIVASGFDPCPKGKDIKFFLSLSFVFSSYPPVLRAYFFLALHSSQQVLLLLGRGKSYAMPGIELRISLYK